MSIGGLQLPLATKNSCCFQPTFYETKMPWSCSSSNIKIV